MPTFGNAAIYAVPIALLNDPPRILASATADLAALLICGSKLAISARTVCCTPVVTLMCWTTVTPPPPSWSFGTTLPVVLGMNSSGPFSPTIAGLPPVATPPFAKAGSPEPPPPPVGAGVVPPPSAPLINPNAASTMYFLYQHLYQAVDD